jgi:hypothetical protein
MYHSSEVVMVIDRIGVYLRLGTEAALGTRYLTVLTVNGIMAE